MGRRAARLLPAAVAAALVAPLAGHVPAGAAPAPTAASMFPGCASPSPSVNVEVGVVACQEMRSSDLGGLTAFSYYVPPACAPAPGRRCPVLYLLHGFGGDYTSMLGTASHPSAWVAALDSEPAVSPYDTPTPWTEADPSTWVPASPLDMILVAPDGRTTPGGYGPAPGFDGYWADWNPRYAKGGDEQTYDTPAPRFADFVAYELPAYVDAHFPVGRGRDWQALAGTSLGGYGSYAIGLLHPDLWSSIGAVSGIMNILLLPGLDPSSARSPVGVSPPAPVPYEQLPGHLVPLADVPGPLQDFAVATYAFGDPTSDQAYYRGNQPRDLAFNALAHASDGQQSLYIRGFSNDAVPRQASDFANPSGYLTAQAFEALVLTTNQELNAAFDDEGVSYHYELHPGIHEDAYWNPWLRSQEEAQYARLLHPGGGGNPPPPPAVFSYRSIFRDFTVWGWHVQVQRADVEFLQLSGVSCSGFTLRGTGTVTVTVPAACGTGFDGSRTVPVDLGPSMPLDAQGTADALPVYGRTVTVALQPLRPSP
jgi:S-formylglutathione hydrolase FrmB